MSAKIGVFPASGKLGSSIVKHLQTLVPASELILISRRPDALAAETRKGAVVRRADYDDPATLERVFDNVGVLMLISYPSIEIDYRFQAHKHAIDAARRSGVKHIFYSSLAFAGDLTDTSVAHVMGAHLATEKYLAALAGRFTYTAVREGIYTESYPMYTAGLDVRQGVDEIGIPHDGTGRGVAWAKRDELGEATAKLVVHYATDPSGFPYLNRILLMSGPREISLQETVEILGRAAGKPGLRIQEISVDEFARAPGTRRALTYRGTEMGREWATAWEAIRRGETGVVTSVLENVLGRDPEDFAVSATDLVNGRASES